MKKRDWLNVFTGVFFITLIIITFIFSSQDKTAEAKTTEEVITSTVTAAVLEEIEEPEEVQSVNNIIILKDDLYAVYGTFSDWGTVTLPDGTTFEVVDAPEYPDGEIVVLILRGNETESLADDLLIYIE